MNKYIVKVNILSTCTNIKDFSTIIALLLVSRKPIGNNTALYRDNRISDTYTFNMGCVSKRNRTLTVIDYK